MWSNALSKDIFVKLYLATTEKLIQNSTCFEVSEKLIFPA